MKHILMMSLLACLVLGVWGCSKPVETPESEVETLDVDTSIVQPDEAYHEDAAGAITDDNAMTRLDTIEQEMAGEDE